MTERQDNSTSWIATAVAGGAVLNYLPADKASGAQSDAARQGLALTREQYEQNLADLSPWRTGGGVANARLMDLLGLGTGSTLGAGEAPQAPTREQFNRMIRAATPGTPGFAHHSGYQQGTPGAPAQYEFDQAGFDAALGQYNAAMQGRAGQLQAGGQFGSLLKPFEAGDLQNEPGYQYGLMEGERGINRAAMAGGSRYSGATLKALQRFGQDYAGTKYNDAFNRNLTNRNTIFSMLSGPSNTGVNAAGQTASLGANAATTGAQLLSNAGDARAAGIVGGANAFTGGINQYLGYRQGQNVMDYLKGFRQPGTDAFSRSGGF